MGVARHVDAGCENAIEVAKGKDVKDKMMKQKTILNVLIKIAKLISFDVITRNKLILVKQI